MRILASSPNPWYTITEQCRQRLISLWVQISGYSYPWIPDILSLDKWRNTTGAGARSRDQRLRIRDRRFRFFLPITGSGSSNLRRIGDQGCRIFCLSLIFSWLYVFLRVICYNRGVESFISTFIFSISYSHWISFLYNCIENISVLIKLNFYLIMNIWY